MWVERRGRNTTTQPPWPPHVLAAPAATGAGVFWSSFWVMAVLAAAGLFGLVFSVLVYEVQARARWARQSPSGRAATQPAASASLDGTPEHSLRRPHLGVLLSDEDARGSDQCPICLEHLQGGERVSELRCDHRFHHACLETWLESGARQVCPLCIRPVDSTQAPAAVAGTRDRGELEIVSL
jgi:hypothetical protein